MGYMGGNGWGIWEEMDGGKGRDKHFNYIMIKEKN